MCVGICGWSGVFKLIRSACGVFVTLQWFGNLAVCCLVST